MKKYFLSKAAIRAGRTTKAGRIRRAGRKFWSRGYTWHARVKEWHGPYGTCRVVKYVGY
jgi:ribosomal protein L4